VDITSLPQVWGLLLGFVLPGLTAVIQQPHWSKNRRIAVAVAVSAIMGTVTVYFAGGLDFTNLVTTLPLVAIAAHTAYEKLWKPSGAAAAIENTTSGYVPSGEVDFQTNVDAHAPAPVPPVAVPPVPPVVPVAPAAPAAPDAGSASD
jgi:hypothetical protein